MQHRRPEQRVEVDDVLADEVDLLGVRRLQEAFEVDAALRAVALEARQITDRRVEPHVEVLARRVRDRDAEVGRVAGDVPVREVLIALALEPLARLVRNLRLQTPRRIDPALEELHAARIGEPEEEMLRRAQLGPCTRERRVGLDQLGRRVDRPADLTGVSVLVLRVTLRALALDVAVGQEHALDRVEELLDRARVDEPCRLEPAIDVLRQLDVLRRVGGVPVIEAQVESLQVPRPIGGDPGDELLRRDAFALGLEHDRRTVRVVRADEVHLVALHALEAHPDVRLDVLHDVADVERAVGVRQCGRDEQFPGHPDSLQDGTGRPGPAGPRLQP